MALVERTHDDTTGVATIRLERPDKRNALSLELLDELVDAIDQASHAGPRALLLTGAGPVFCAGGDIQAMSGRLGDPTATARALREHLHPPLLALSDFPAPTVCAVQGGAIGAGLGLVLACDIVVAATDARLGAVQTGLGLTPDGGTTWALPRLLGPKRAMRMVLAAETIDGAQAAELGLVTEAVPPDELAETASSTAALLATGPTRAFVQARSLLAQAMTGTFAEALDREADAQAMMYATEDQREGVTAFLAKRPPAFTGR